jgi:zinc transporter ZupT
LRDNIAVGVATLAGALAGYLALADMQHVLSTALAIAASSLLYVAVADLIRASTGVRNRSRP